MSPSLIRSSSHSLPTHTLTHTPHPTSYVLSLLPLPSKYAISYSSPLTHIGLLDPLTLHELSLLQGHAAPVTALHALGDGVLSASMDGTVRRWDPREGGCVATLSSGKAELLSVSAAGDGALVAAGSELVGEDALLYFWDLRTGKQLHSHSSTHSDDITCLSFHPSSTTLLSGSTDGLLCLTNPLEAEEDEAVLEVGNWGVSVADAGWGEGRVWARSDMETVSVWDQELNLVHDFGDARVPEIENWKTDYVVQCSLEEEDMVLLAGSNEGSFAQIRANPQGWILDRTFVGGHEGIVRCVLVDNGEGRMVSGGEDGRVVSWDLGAGDSEHAGDVEKEEEEEDGMEVDHPQPPPLPREVKSPVQKGRKKARYEPYAR
ncbi:WD40 repeat-like protein [Dacryopinax primogenitus]|uniref:WD40 repeat-like protein n=1 Tax=Dacryopinax primogenitus (strain DJM 731) TaxID=1858805 RepID=M5GFI9_DACPD|nr:WD40 repeat-like protein [Dacryopinax primogenitus]EJU06347.1 WD40 repeat-like protein [Dacryopinax primogenitus]